MRKDILIWNVIKVTSIPKIIFFRFFYGIKFPFGSIIYGIPKIRSWKLISIWRGFQLWRLCRLNWKINIWSNFFMNEFGTLSAGSSQNGKITIWDNVMIWPFFYMISWDHWFNPSEKFNTSNSGKFSDITIWNNVWIWARVTILKWVTIWDNVVIWAGSVVTKSIEGNSVAVWNPCKVIKKL
jgi:acetyltransferase-like isoleucine patch superfamily enzyme